MVKLCTRILFSALVAAIFGILPECRAEELLSNSISYFSSRYASKGHQHSAFWKTVQNDGSGPSYLAGTRNFRAVLPGLVYRGGATGGLMVPLSQHALTNLCQEGFGTAIYLYETGYSTSNASVRCKPLSGVSNSAGNGNELAYVDKPISNSKIANLNLNDILRLIHQRIVSPNDHRPVYMHCWNGWHASGYASAIVLRQFCGWSGAQALEYWKCATDRNDYGYSQLRDDILNFKPMSSLKITGSVSREICPTISTSECPGIKQ